MNAPSKPFVTPDNMSRIIQQWFFKSRQQRILLTDNDFGDANIPGVVFYLPEFMAMLRKFDELSHADAEAEEL